MLGYIKKHSEITVERGIMPESLSIDEKSVDDNDAYPISVSLRQLPPAVEPELPESSAGSVVPNGLFRSNLTADNTDTLLSNAKEDLAQPTETIEAKYLVGCDGAHSWTRRQIGCVMEGEQTDFIWFVIVVSPPSTCSC